MQYFQYAVVCADFMTYEPLCVSMVRGGGGGGLTYSNLPENFAIRFL